MYGACVPGALPRAKLSDRFGVKNTDQVFTPKGWNNIARGNAPGKRSQPPRTLKGCGMVYL